MSGSRTDGAARGADRREIERGGLARAVLEEGMMYRWIAFVVTGLTLGTLPACHECTLIGGDDGLIVDVTVTGSSLPPDRYTIVARVAGAELEASNVIAADGSVSGAPAGDVVVEGKHLFLQGSLFATAGTIVVGFREGGGPSAVELEVRRGSAVLAHGSFTPAYARVTPNGDSCPPALEQAHETLTLDARTLDAR